MRFENDIFPNTEVFPPIDTLLFKETSPETNNFPLKELSFAT